MRLRTLFSQEMKNAMRGRQNFGLLLVFTLIATVLISIVVDPKSQVEGPFLIGFLWVIVALATQLAVPGLWDQDMEDGTLQQLRLVGISAEVILLAKVLPIFVFCFGGLGFMLPILAYTLNLSEVQIFSFLICYVILSPALSFLALTGATLTLGHRRGSLLSSILLLPLYLPFFIFACTISLGEAPLVYYLILASLSLTLSPLLLYANVYLIKTAT